MTGQQLHELKALKRPAKPCKAAANGAAAYQISGISFRNTDRTERIGERADHSITAALQYVGINLRGADILVPELFLYRANIHAAFQQVSGKGMTQGMTAGRLLDTRLAYRHLHRFLQAAIIQMMTACHTRTWIDAAPGSREHALPAPRPVGLWIFAGQGMRQPDGTKTIAQMLVVQIMR